MHDSDFSYLVLGLCGDGPHLGLPQVSMWWFACGNFSGVCVYMFKAMQRRTLQMLCCIWWDVNLWAPRILWNSRSISRIQPPIAGGGDFEIHHSEFQIFCLWFSVTSWEKKNTWEQIFLTFCTPDFIAYYDERDIVCHDGDLWATVGLERVRHGLPFLREASITALWDLIRILGWDWPMWGTNHFLMMRGHCPYENTELPHEEGPYRCCSGHILFKGLLHC